MSDLDLKIKRLQESNKGRSEVAYHPGRLQPYTVWLNGLVYRFCTNEEDALESLYPSRRGMA